MEFTCPLPWSYFLKGEILPLCEKRKLTTVHKQYVPEWCLINIFSVLHTVLQGIISTFMDVETEAQKSWINLPGFT